MLMLENGKGWGVRNRPLKVTTEDIKGKSIRKLTKKDINIVIKNSST